MYFFWFFWGVDAIATVLFGYYFWVGLGDNSISSTNARFWYTGMVALPALLLSSLWLYTQHYVLAATLLLAPLALPSLFYALVALYIYIVSIVKPTRWN